MTDQHRHDETAHLTPNEVETELEAARRQFIQGKIDAGWKPKDGFLVHPTDADLRLIVDPFTGEITFSPKLLDQLDEDGSADRLAELIREDIEHKRRSGE
jgi:hypothetical protein